MVSRLLIVCGLLALTLCWVSAQEAASTRSAYAGFGATNFRRYSPEEAARRALSPEVRAELREKLPDFAGVAWIEVEGEVTRMTEEGPVIETYFSSFAPDLAALRVETSEIWKGLTIVEDGKYHRVSLDYGDVTIYNARMLLAMDKMGSFFFLNPLNTYVIDWSLREFLSEEGIHEIRSYYMFFREPETGGIAMELDFSKNSEPWRVYYRFLPDPDADEQFQLREIVYVSWSKDLPKEERTLENGREGGKWVFDDFTIALPSGHKLPRRAVSMGGVAGDRLIQEIYEVKTVALFPAIPEGFGDYDPPVGSVIEDHSCHPAFRYRIGRTVIETMGSVRSLDN